MDIDLSQSFLYKTGCFGENYYSRYWLGMSGKDIHQHHWLCSPLYGYFSQHNITHHDTCTFSMDTTRCDVIYNIACSVLLTEYDCTRGTLLHFTRRPLAHISRLSSPWVEGLLKSSSRRVVEGVQCHRQWWKRVGEMAMDMAMYCA